MKKYIISIALALSLMACNDSDQEEFQEETSKYKCDCVFTEKKTELFQYEIGQPTIITYSDPQIGCGFDTNGWEYLGSNVGNGKPTSGVSVYIEVWRKVECPK